MGMTIGLLLAQTFGYPGYPVEFGEWMWDNFWFMAETFVELEIAGWYIVWRAITGQCCW